MFLLLQLWCSTCSEGKYNADEREEGGGRNTDTQCHLE